MDCDNNEERRRNWLCHDGRMPDHPDVVHDGVAALGVALADDELLESPRAPLRDFAEHRHHRAYLPQRLALQVSSAVAKGRRLHRRPLATRSKAPRRAAALYLQTQQLRDLVIDPRLVCCGPSSMPEQEALEALGVANQPADPPVVEYHQRSPPVNRLLHHNVAAEW